MDPHNADQYAESAKRRRLDTQQNQSTGSAEHTDYMGKFLLNWHNGYGAQCPRLGFNCKLIVIE